MPEGEKVIFASYVTKPYVVLSELKDGNAITVSSEDIAIGMQSAKARKVSGVPENEVTSVHAIFYQDGE
jgi:hypothetical protein